MRFPAKSTSSCIWVAYLSIELFYIGMPVQRTDGGRAYGHVITKISRRGRLPHFLRYGATLAILSLFFYIFSSSIDKPLLVTLPAK